MNRADHEMYRTIKRILDMDGFLDVDPRPKYKDGSPAHTWSINHTFRQYDLAAGEFPILSLRPIAWKTAIREIFTIYQKPTNVISEMEEMGVNWWGDWDIGDGTIGQRYGATVKRYGLVDKLIDDIQKDPYGRRKIMSLWQETDLAETDGLAPCAFLTIWNVRNDNHGNEFLDMCLIQRSGDLLTASGPGGINEVQYAALLMMIARHCNYIPGVFSHFVANEQIYTRHVEQAYELVDRFRDLLDIESSNYHNDENYTPVPSVLVLNPNKSNFYDFTVNDFVMMEYQPIKPQLELELGI